MFILAKLVFESYIPEKLEKGMYFKQRIKDVIFGKVYEYDRIFILNHMPFDKESYIITNGYPVIPTIYTITDNPDDIAGVIATADMIGWWDEGEHSDELRDVEIKDFNYVLEEEDGYLEIEIDDNELEQGIVEPKLYMGKCTIRLATDEEYEYDDDEDDYEEPWDETDDLTDYDNPEWPNDHPKDKWDTD